MSLLGVIDFRLHCKNANGYHPIVQQAIVLHVPPAAARVVKVLSAFVLPPQPAAAGAAAAVLVPGKGWFLLLAVHAHQPL